MFEVYAEISEAVNTIVSHPKAALEIIASASAGAALGFSTGADAKVKLNPFQYIDPLKKEPKVMDAVTITQGGLVAVLATQNIFPAFAFAAGYSIGKPFGAIYKLKNAVRQKT